jgi:hypothetical protein
VTELADAAYPNDDRQLLCSVKVGADAELLSCTRLALDDWRGLAFTSVIVPGDHYAGSPRVGDHPNLFGLK